MNSDIPTITNRNFYTQPEVPSVFDRIEAQLRLTNDRRAARDFTMDVRLAWLSGQVGNVANDTSHEHGLLRVAAVAVAWLEAMELPAAFVHTSIAEEHLRQRQLFADKNISFVAEAPAADCWRKLRVLVKTLGRVAQAVEGWEAAPREATSRNRLMAELVQVAAVAIVWLESVGEEIEMEKIKFTR
ncbi:MAG TPA: hypothetical protein VG347_04625 [Verrucomicrobiae bacterium]|nr:hypothetical protein [Verrucomicrobiae bacterium]